MMTLLTPHDVGHIKDQNIAPWHFHIFGINDVNVGGIVPPQVALP